MSLTVRERKKQSSTGFSSGVSVHHSTVRISIVDLKGCVVIEKKETKEQKRRTFALEHQTWWKMWRKVLMSVNTWIVRSRTEESGENDARKIQHSVAVWKHNLKK